MLGHRGVAPPEMVGAEDELTHVERVNRLSRKWRIALIGIQMIQRRDGIDGRDLLVVRAALDSVAVFVELLLHLIYLN